MFYDIEPKLPLGNAIHCAKLDELLEKSMLLHFMFQKHQVLKT